jgi:hypothetical protein
MKTTRFLLLLAAVSGAAWLTGCSTPETRISSNPEVFARLTPQEQSLIRAGQLGLGFTAEAVKLALGPPDRVTMTTDASGQLEVWHYAETVYYDGAFLYGGPYWGGWGRRGRWWGGYWGGYGDGPYPVGPVNTYDRFRVEFRNNKVVAFSQELAK